jgi:hypothetical protein
MPTGVSSSEESGEIDTSSSGFPRPERPQSFP